MPKQIHPSATGPGELTDAQRRVVAEIQRVARVLGKESLSQREFDEHHQLAGVTTAGYQFGSWNDAVEAAGLRPHPQHGEDRGPRITDLELLEELLRLRNEFGEFPSERKLASHGRYSPKPYRDRWGTIAAARDAALALESQRGDV